jgi:hypothetical protein
MPTPAVLHCPRCGVQHVDRGKWATFDHRRHLCHGCGTFFEDAAPNVGVAALPQTLAQAEHADAPVSDPRRDG